MHYKDVSSSVNTPKNYSVIVVIKVYVRTKIKNFIIQYIYHCNLVFLSVRNHGFGGSKLHVGEGKRGDICAADSALVLVKAQEHRVH